MGKKKDKKSFDKMSFPKQYEFLRDQADNYNIDMRGYSPFGDASGRFGDPTGSYSDLGEVIAKREYDNFSNRMALQEAALAGNDKAAKLLAMDEGINRTAAVENWMEKQHGKHVGGGDYTWGSDPAGVAQHFAEVNRDALLAAAAGKANANGRVSSDFSDFSASRGYELSPELDSAIERNQDFVERRLAGKIFQPIRTEPDESELIAQEILEAEEAEQTNRENQFLFDYINTMELA